MQHQTQAWGAEHFTLCEQKISNCAGDLFCWIRTPGVCNLNDDYRANAEALVACDLMIYLPPITFWGHVLSSQEKQTDAEEVQPQTRFFEL